jgi:serine/threonine protein phosphatase PrpC
LVDKANEKGGFDNISVIIIRGREGRWEYAAERIYIK